MNTRYIFVLKTLSLLGFFIQLTACNDTPKTNGNSKPSIEDSQNKMEHKKAEAVVFTPQQFDALQMEVGTPTMKNMNDYVEANGQLEVPPQNEAKIMSLIGANVVSIEVIEGDKVDKNQVVAYLSHPNIIQKQTDYLNAHGNSVLLKKAYERQKKLYEAGASSGKDFQKIEADFNAAKIMVRGLEAQLQQYNINPDRIRSGNLYTQIALRSPIEGFVEKVAIKMGEYVAPQTNLFEIVNTKHVHVDLMVFEKDVHKIKKGQKIRFNVQSVPETELTAEIYSIGKIFEEDPKALHVHAEIDNDKGNLIPGMYIQGRIEVSETKTMALPKEAIVKNGEKSFVFMAKKDENQWQFKPLEVIPGKKDNDWIAIKFLNTITPDTNIVLNNAYYLMAEMKKSEAEHSH